MGYLIVASVLFAFSFGLIGRYLAGADAVMVSFLRLAISCVVFLPFLRLRKIRLAEGFWLAGIGAVQYGVMYLAYIYAFRFLAGHEVALFTVFTPVYVTLLHDWRRGRFHVLYFLAALLAVMGGAILTGRPSGGALQGILLIQVSNVCFAVGQVEYKLLCERRGRSGNGLEHYALLYLGGACLAGMVAYLGRHDAGFGLGWDAWLVLLYLGLVPSALGFYCWNQGARRVNAGVLAACNNFKIPLAVLVSLLVFGEEVHAIRMGIGIICLVGGLAITRLQHKKV